VLPAVACNALFTVPERHSKISTCAFMRVFMQDLRQSSA